MRWGHPSVLYLLTLLPVVVLFLFWARRRKKRDLSLFAGTEFDLLLTRNLSVWRRIVKDILLVLGVALLVIALARPQWGERWEETKRRGVDIFVAVDLSKSMLAGDVSPSRMERARRKLTDLVPLLEGDRIGLIGFAGKAFVLMPLTLDYNVLPLYIDSLSPDLLTVPGTALSSAVNPALRSFEKNGPVESHAMILMSDGEDLSGETAWLPLRAVASAVGSPSDAVDALPREAAEAIDTALSKGIQINTLGIGTPEGAPIPEPGGGFKKDRSGQLVLTRLEEGPLQKMAEETGGIYVRSVASDDDLKLIYQSIRRGREEKELKGGRERRLIDRYQWFLGLAILLLLLEAVMSLTLRKQSNMGGTITHHPESNRGVMKETRKEKPSRAVLLLILLGVLSLPGPAFAFGTIGTIREGESLYEAGKYEEALQKFLQAQKTRPDDPRLQYNLGNTYHQLKRYEEAEKIFSKGVEGASSNPAFQEQNFYNQGNNQYRQGALEDAIRSYEEALKIDPKDEDARYNLEFVKKQLEQKKKHDQKNQASSDQDQKKSEQDQSQQGKQDQPSEEKQSGEKQTEEKKGQSGQDDQNGKMGQEEAKRWLSGLKEGRPRVYSGGDKKGDGKQNVEKDW